MDARAAALLKPFQENYHDGLMGREELAYFMKTIDPHFTEEKLSTLLEYAGADQNGQIEFEKFIGWIFGNDSNVDAIKAKLRSAGGPGGLCIAGEVLIDMLPRKEKNEEKEAFLPCPGGSPFNALIAAVRLGVPVSYLATLSTDMFGEQLHGILSEEGINLDYVTRVDRPTTLAFVNKNGGMGEKYAFFKENSADRALTKSRVKQVLSENHFDAVLMSLGAVTLEDKQMAESFMELFRSAGKQGALRAFDPNLRNNMIKSGPEGYRKKIEELLKHVDVVKGSDADVEYLYGDVVDYEKVAHKWLKMGPRLVMITCGAKGAMIWVEGSYIHQPPLAVNGKTTDGSGLTVPVIDTVGCGDTFMGSVVQGLMANRSYEYSSKAPLLNQLKHGKAWDAESVAHLRKVVQRASCSAAINASRSGCNPPTAAEVLDAGHALLLPFAEGVSAMHKSAPPPPAGYSISGKDAPCKTRKKSMPVAAQKLLLVRPKVPCPLDLNFSPLVLGKRNYLKHAKHCAEKLQWALPRSDGCARYTLPVFSEGSEYYEASVYFACILIQEMMYQRGAAGLLLSGPAKICQSVKNAFSIGGEYEFEVRFFPYAWSGGKKFDVRIVAHPADLPPELDSPQACGKDANGCRLAYDLGKSDIKTVAVQDGKILYSKETEWDVTNPDPSYHYNAVKNALKLAKEKLPRVDAVGGSTTGTVTPDSKAIWCDLFPNVPPNVFQRDVVDFHKKLAKDLAGDVPMKVLNDGEVTAVAAVQTLKSGNCLGISMGSTEGAGYANADGHIMGWMNEFGFFKLDLNPEAPPDPWTEGNYTGLSHLYLGQRAATKLAHKVVEVPDNYKYPHPDTCTMNHALHAQCLKLVQKGMADPKQEPKVRKLYESLGVYLGYALAQYSEFYKIDHVMVLGRVSKGKGGDVMFDKAREVLTTEFPELNIQLHTGDDHFKAVGQCIAAASLPPIKKKTKPIMPKSAQKLLLTRPKVPAPLDLNFSPLVLAKRNYLKQAKDCREKLQWALPRADGCARYTLPVFPEGSEYFEASVYFAGVLIQEMIYQRGAAGLMLSGPTKICKALKAAYSVGGQYEFETTFMPYAWSGGKRFDVEIVSAGDLPAEYDSPQAVGKEANGCRLAYDLGKSDIKTVAVQDGQILYSKETEWDVTNPDPSYHYNAVKNALTLAKEKLPRIDAVGGSTTGTVTADSKAIWCDLFPNVPDDVFQKEVVDFHTKLAKDLAGDVPVKVLNDGEVTAVAAVQTLKSGNCLGISMGSTEGAGYANADGNIMGWMNEFGFFKLDMNPEAPFDPWTEGNSVGLSHMYLGQRAASKLAHKVVEVPENYVYPHPDMLGMNHFLHAQCLKLVQKGMADPKQEPRVRKLYETLGVYLGYALAQYSEFYKIDHVMVLGRVSKGKGGDVMFDKAKEVLRTEFPELNIQLHTGDDHFKAVGQCIAAASLPPLR